MSELTFSLNLPASPDKLMQVATDYDNAIKYMPPEQTKSIKVLEKKDNQTTTEETITFEAIKYQEIVQQSVHKVTLPNKINSEVISGPLKGTKLEIVFERNDSGTKVVINANLKLALKYKLLEPLIKNKYKLFVTAILYKMNTAAM